MYERRVGETGENFNGRKGEARCRVREYLPHSIYEVTRVCRDERHWLRPSVATNEVMGFCMAEAVRMSGVKVLGWCVLENFQRIVVEDKDCAIAGFMRILGQHSAGGINRLLGRRGELWKGEPFQVTRLEDELAVAQSLAETSALPVKLGLVGKGRDWPGLRSNVNEMDGVGRLFKRPQSGYFRVDGPWLELSELKFCVPSFVGEGKKAGWLKELAERCRSVEKKYKRYRLEKGLGFRGKFEILRGSVMSESDVAEGQGRRNKVWGGCIRVHRRAHLRSSEFRERYALERVKWSRGSRNVCFPAGTYGLLVFHGANCDWSSGGFLHSG